MDSLRSNNRGFNGNAGNGWFTPEHNGSAMHIHFVDLKVSDIGIPTK